MPERKHKTPRGVTRIESSKGGRLKYWLALPTTIVVSLLLAVSIAADVCLQKNQNEESLHEQAYILSQQMQAVWDFMTVNQDRINTDADGSYNFKGLHCSIVGTSVGALFSDRTDYILRYVSDTPRNERNLADGLESEAINAFKSNETLKEYSAFSTMDNGIEYYRYITPLKMNKGCVSCHGKPAGEMDVTGFEKEGFDEGDLIGVASISIPTDTYQSNLNVQIALRALLSAAILAACLLTIYCVTMRYVIKPIGKVETAVRNVGAGILETRINPNGINAKGELNSLSNHFNMMASELDSLRKNLEDKVEERTEQLAEANEMLAQQAQELEAANKQLKDDDRYKSHYFTMMSHELRTPLTAIRAYIGMLSDPDVLDDNTYRNTVQAIHANTVTLSKLVNNILDSARLEAGAIKLEKHVVDASDIMNEVSKTLKPLATAKNIHLGCHTSENVPLFFADEGKLLHILENLGSNAIKYSYEGGEVNVAAYLHPDGKFVCFDVADNGIGIPKEEQELVFQKFRQAESAVAKPVSGSGLGLSLAKEYAELHGGGITVASEPDKGSIFTVYIPFEEPDFGLEGDDVQ